MERGHAPPSSTGTTLHSEPSQPKRGTSGPPSSPGRWLRSAGATGFLIKPSPRPGVWPRLLCDPLPSPSSSLSLGSPLNDSQKEEGSNSRLSNTNSNNPQRTPTQPQTLWKPDGARPGSRRGREEPRPGGQHTQGNWLPRAPTRQVLSQHIPRKFLRITRWKVPGCLLFEAGVDGTGHSSERAQIKCVKGELGNPDKGKKQRAGHADSNMDRFQRS